MEKATDKSHLKMDDRVEIATGLAQRKTATEIAEKIGCAKTTVSREVKGHYTVERKGAYGKGFNDCSNRSSCKVAHECLDCRNPRKSSCAYCGVICYTVHGVPEGEEQPVNPVRAVVAFGAPLAPAGKRGLLPLVQTTG